MIAVDDDHAPLLGEKRHRALSKVDAMPPGLRLCVHEFGLPIVTACLQRGIRQPSHIRQLVHEIWEGARQPAQKREHAGCSKAVNQLDWLLIQAGAQINAMTLVRMMSDAGLVIVPRDPNRFMVEASTETVSNFTEAVTKQQKHRRRLRAAIAAATRSLWPHLVDPHL
jgi:hypothetical protein